MNKNFKLFNDINKVTSDAIYKEKNKHTCDESRDLFKNWIDKNLISMIKEKAEERLESVSLEWNQGNVKTNGRLLTTDQVILISNFIIHSLKKPIQTGEEDSITKMIRDVIGCGFKIKTSIKDASIFIKWGEL